MHFGAAKGCKSAVLVTIGTGVGTAVCLNGKLHLGTRGLVEGGHAIVVPEGRACACGQKGCLEAYSSGSAIASRARDVGLDAESCESICAAADSGNVKAVGVLEEAAVMLAMA